MASNCSGLEGKYLYDTPYSLTRDIILSLDADKGWEQLAAEIGYSFDKIKIFELEYQRHNGSPTKTLLWDLGSRNTTLRELYLKLQKANRVREMKIIEKYLEGAKPSNISNSENEKDLLPSNSCTPSLPLDLKLTGLPQPPPPRRANEVNFNNPMTQPTKMACETSDKEKLLHDKIIPGFKQDQPSLSGRVTSSEKKRWPQEGTERLPSESSLPVKSHSLSDNASTPSNSNGSSSVLTSATSKSTSSSEVSSSANPSSQGAMQSITSMPNIDNLKGVNSMNSVLTANNMNLDVAMTVLSTPVFTYKDLAHATNGFDDCWKLGEGAFGKVYYGVLRDSKCAIKRLEEDITEDVHSKRHQQMRSELSALLRYRHENIVTLYGYALDGPSLCLVYQYMVNGSLEDRLQCHKGTAPLSWEKRISIALGAAHGLQYFHKIGEKPLIHGDIKSANILLDRHFEAKIGDLGQAQQATSGAITGKFTHITKKCMSTKIYGTKAYFAPEVMRGSEMSVKSDVYAFGVVLLEICSGEKAFDERREPNTFIVNHFGEVTEICPEETWLNVFQDKKAGQCEESLVIRMLKCAMQCVSHTKKQRPDMTMVVHDLEQIEKKRNELYGGGLQGPDSYSQMSHTSAAVISGTNMAGNPDPPSHIQKVHPTVIIPNTPILTETADRSTDEDGPESLRLQKMYDKKSKDVSLPVASPRTASPICSLPPGSRIPDPLKLQLKFDMKQEGQDSREIARKIDQLELESVNSLAPGSSTEDYASDPKKIAQIEEADAELRKENPGIQVLLNSENRFHIPKTDPAKLAAMKMFDANKSLTKSPTELNEHQSDSSKMKNIEEFDKKNIPCSTEGDGDEVSIKTENISNVQPLQDDDFPSYKLFGGPQTVIQASSLPVTLSEQVVYRENRNTNASNPAYRESEGFLVSKSLGEFDDSLTGNDNTLVGQSGQDLDMQAFFERYKQATAGSDIDEEDKDNADNEMGEEEKGEEKADSCVCEQTCELSQSSTSLQAPED
ncbi:LRR receptor-like serine/threonine-protein kinase GSO2 [Gigantopelta aegis]|uniref:LRR receptor-like serine/threonine-protein kinase GSO2 n=1 Tax=Gigantopelta aegis TaxID=1735272 RepID=UPI001B88B625|nr:LRR receptor-like serine/threonine-protein kinase GSO2 [Gigantopelta aegis]